MNEDHVIAAILTAGLVSRSNEDDLAPKDVVTLYNICLSELIATNRAKREEK